MNLRPFTVVLCLIAAAGVAACTFAPEDVKPEKQTIRVDSAKAFVEALGPDRIMLVEAGAEIRLDESPRGRGKHFRWVEANPGEYELIIRDCANLEIRAAEGERPLICTKHPYANVLHFENCNGLVLSGLRIGHDPKPGYCSGGVVAMTGCESPTISDCILFGCGIEGLTLSKVKKLVFENSIVEKCTYGLLSANACDDLTFRKSTFRDTVEFHGFHFNDTLGIRFVDCIVENNRLGELDYPLFLTNLNVEAARIVFEGGVIRKNRAAALVRPAGMLKTDKTEIADNTWTGEEE